MSYKEDSFIHIDPTQVQKLIDQGATLVDIREPDELEEVVPGARFLPLSALNGGHQPQFTQEDKIIYYCRSGRRTRLNANQLFAVAQPAKTLYIVDGGISAWKARGLPLLRHNIQLV